MAPLFRSVAASLLPALFLALFSSPADAASATRLVPVVLDVVGTGGAHFTTELVVSNAGTTDATVTLTYTASPYFGGAGSGSTTVTIAAGTQARTPDTIAFLRGRIPSIPDGPGQGGSLRVTFDGLSSATAGSVVARTTAPSGNGRAGLAYSGIDPARYTASLTAVVGLLENGADRSNLALVNAGTGGPVTLHVTLISGDGFYYQPLSPDIVLQPGEWTQLNRVLTSPGAGFTDGWAFVERVAGSDPFFAYGVVNDNVTNDGSYLPCIDSDGWDVEATVPALVETPEFQSELTLTNPNNFGIYAYVNYYESLTPPLGPTGTLVQYLGPWEQVVIPDVLNEMRMAGASIGPRGGSYAGALAVTFSDGYYLWQGVAAARTTSPAPSGGAYGLAYPGPIYSQAALEAYVFGLAQNGQARSNLAIVNAGANNATITVSYDVYDGDTGAKAYSDSVVLAPGQWFQRNGVLGGIANGYVHLTVTSGNDEFFAYGVVNDGATDTSGTNDGAYVPMDVVR
jgi:hypothetical protein